MLVLLYYLSQNPDFSDSVKPLMAKLKDSEEMLRFLKDLSSFTQTFSAFKSDPAPEKNEKQPKPNGEKSDGKKGEEKPQSPTEGIADAFIQNILESYLKGHA